MMRYISNHWRGNHSLSRSFWINLVCLRVVILLFERFTHPPFTEQTAVALLATALYFVFFHLIVIVWQVRGLLKSCDRYMLERGSYSKVLAAQAGIVAGIFLTLFVSLGAFQSLFEDPAAMFKNRFQKSPPLLGEFTLTLGQQGTHIHLNGDFNIGLTKHLKVLLQNNPNVEAIILNSGGGRVSEGRGVARLILEYGLDTYVYESCSSACVTAFIGGVKRNLGAHGKLGFHQFSVNSAQKTPYIDPKAEQQIDRAFYIRQKISPDFLQQIFRASHSEIWFPTSAELLSSGVIHLILKKR